MAKKVSEKIQLDPDKFAYQVMTSVPIKDFENKDPERIAKDRLTQYLSAYYLATRFNLYELDRFDNISTEKAYPSLSEVLAKIDNAHWEG